MGRQAAARLVTADAEELLATAEAAARAAGDLLLSRFESGRTGAVSAKSTPTDLVSESDLAAEALIREIIGARRPGDAIVGEEGETKSGTTGLRWIVDPLDGTVNYLYGNPVWCVSVACEGIAGVVFDPNRDELFASGDDRLPGSACDELSQALVATGFGYDSAVRARQAEVVSGVLPGVRDIRRGGSAALDMCWNAAGRVDAYFEYGVKEWDVAAGRLICAAAGLVVEDLPGGGVLPPGIMVAPAGIAAELRALLP